MAAVYISFLLCNCILLRSNICFCSVLCEADGLGPTGAKFLSSSPNSGYLCGGNDFGDWNDDWVSKNDFEFELLVRLRVKLIKETCYWYSFVFVVWFLGVIQGKLSAPEARFLGSGY